MPVSSGEPLRIKASDWNDVLSMLRNWKGVQGSSPTGISLPCVTATLSGYRPVVGEAVILTQFGLSQIDATVPLSESMTFTQDERELRANNLGRCVKMRPDYAEPPEPSPDQPFAVCLDPRSMKFAISGLAWVRVRRLRAWHRFVRRCVPQPGDTVEQSANSVGVLDSCGWGPGQIVGGADGYQLGGVTGYRQDSIVWLLIRF
jgi:hypothetical protein